MEEFETRFKQADVLPMVKHFMDELDLFNLFTTYVPAAAGSLADHAESLCILTANIICDNSVVRLDFCIFNDGEKNKKYDFSS